MMVVVVEVEGGIDDGVIAVALPLLLLLGQRS